MTAPRVILVALAAMVCLVTLPATSDALPRMSATSGAPCTTCHFNPDGGGLRSEIGWGTQWMTGAIDHDTTGLGFLHNRSTNRVLDWMAVGVDARVQVTRLGQPTLSVDDAGDPQVNAPRRAAFPMQLQPYLAIAPSSSFNVQGSLDIVPFFYDDGVSDDLCTTPYPGQTCGQAHLTVDPFDTGPSLRAGLFRPSLGIRHDDHSMLLLADASRDRPWVIPPNYAEAGAEISYQPRHWIRADAGAFHTRNLARAVGDPGLTEGAGQVAGLARVSYFPRFDLGPDRTLYGWLGASVYGDADQRFRIDQGFFGLGWLDRGSLMAELAHLQFGPDADRRAINTALIATYSFADWFVAEGRVERAATNDHMADQSHLTYAATAGVHFYPVPFVKLRPEYRFVTTDTWSMGQYTVQLHLFY